MVPAESRAKLVHMLLLYAKAPMLCTETNPQGLLGQLPVPKSRAGEGKPDTGLLAAKGQVPAVPKCQLTSPNDTAYLLSSSRHNYL